MKIDKHLFAVYAKNVTFDTTQQPRDIFVYKDEDTWNRITKIVRLKPNDHLIIFNDQYNLTLKLTQECFSKKNHLIGTLVERSFNKPCLPKIILYQGITKKPAYEDICYAAAQLGVSRIIPVKTAKVQRTWEGPREHERLHKVMIAACEQSKQFVIPQLEEPITLTQLCATKHVNALLFEHGGGNILDTVSKKEQTISCFVGPEGGMTQEEITLLKENNFTAVKLTSSILRAQDAVLVALGTVRCITE